MSTEARVLRAGDATDKGLATLAEPLPGASPALRTLLRAFTAMERKRSSIEDELVLPPARRGEAMITWGDRSRSERLPH